MTHPNAGRKHSETAKLRMRAKWTPERRAKQAERAKTIPKRERQAHRAVRLLKQWTPEARREAAVRAWRAYWQGNGKAKIQAYWTPERRRLESARKMAMHQGAKE